jgi:hypothetical protein
MGMKTKLGSPSRRILPLKPAEETVADATGFDEFLMPQAPRKKLSQSFPAQDKKIT